jgi:hypothetical protein
VLLAAVSALAATAAAAAGPLARVRRRVLQNLRDGTREGLGQSVGTRGTLALELRSNRRSEANEWRVVDGGEARRGGHLAERVVLVLERGHPLLQLRIAELQALGLRLQLRQVRLLPLPRLLRGHAVPQQPLQPVLLLVPRRAPALLPARRRLRPRRHLPLLAVLPLGTLVRAGARRGRRRRAAHLRHPPYLLVALRPWGAMRGRAAATSADGTRNDAGNMSCHGLGAAPTSFREVVASGAGGALAAGGERARGARLRLLLLLLLLLLLRSHLPPPVLPSPLRQQIRISSLQPPLLLGLRLLPEKKKSNLCARHGQEGDRQGGRKADADRTREKGRERGGERKSLCAGREREDGRGGRGEKWRSVGLGVFG